MIGSIRANTGESGISGTSVVSIFPHGAAACGAQDMAGNVWERCSTLLIPYPFKGEVAAESLYTANKLTCGMNVVRGGSWIDSRARARCAYRISYFPGFDFDYFGFRLARLFSAE